ncbi:MAG: ATP-dependent Clp protease ATP-binding subunit [Ruminococcaceae bacterium]|nr:ATP-dependent Clp protease ATP-binding subunit [Oscillospiraceae bacterium]
MNLPICAKCKKRPAAVFITKHENGKTVNEGFCLVCAREMGVKPLDNILKQMGISGNDIAAMAEDFEEAIAEASENLPEISPDNQDDNGDIDVNRLFSGMGFTPIGGASSDAAKKKKKGGKQDESRKFLNTYCTSLTEKAKSGKTDRIIGRERELARVIQILCRRQKNNPCLIGEPGVGKTAIAEALAARIVESKVPEVLMDHEVWLLDLTALVAGTQFRGQFESRILGLIKEVKAAGNIILVIDEVHNIVGAGDSEGSMSAANMLKPALSRGEIQVIGATTLKEYRKYIEKDSALERRFQPVMVNEPSVEETVEVITGIKDYYEAYHGVHITPEVARAAVMLSERYITDRFLPDKAIDLIDEAASRASITSDAINEKRRNVKLLRTLEEKKSGLESLVEKPEGQTESNYKELADVKVQLLRLEQREAELNAELDSIYLTVNDLASVVEIWTGIPASDINAGEMAELRGLGERISAKIIGQDEAVGAVVRAIKRKRAGISYRRNPVSMIFAGPTGVGKTELVKVLARELFRQPEALIRLDMSEFMEKHAVSRIIGAPPGYVGYDEAGQLTEKIRRRPYSVILFDEIEKAHPDVLNILLQILDDGKITDAQGRVVNFENTVIIMTTNAGSNNSSSISGFAEKREARSADKTERALLEFLRPEFINRIDEIITFNHLNRDNFLKIADLMLTQLKDAMAEKEIRLTYSEDVLGYIAEKSFSEKYGARNMRRFIEKQVEDPIAARIIDAYPAHLMGIHLSMADGELAVSSI